MNIVRHYRERMGLTQDGLAIKAELNVKSIYRAEQDVHNATMYTLDKLAKALRVPTWYLVAYHGHWKNGKCSHCGAPIAYDSKKDFLDEEDNLFCYSCGCVMDLEEGSDE